MAQALLDPVPRPEDVAHQPGVRAALSPSRAADFLQCPLLYRFRVVDRLAERPTAAAVRGTIVHAVLERLFDLPAAERTVAAARDLVLPQWQQAMAERPELAQLFALDAGETTGDHPRQRGDACNEASAPVTEAASAPAAKGAPPHDFEAWLASTGALLERWFTLEDPSRLEPAERELYVETTLDDGLVLRGYVDRLDVAPTGEVRVVDYKTGRAPAEAFEAKAMFQMRFYGLVLWRSRGVLPRLLQLVYLGDGQVLRYAPDEDDLRATERKVSALWQAIDRAARSGDWRPRRSRLCTWCDHQARCPAWGGTPPPLPTGARDRAVDPAVTGAVAAPLEC
ncbi:MAG: RecB family exonuclease [Angustibacter sp.]